MRFMRAGAVSALVRRAGVAVHRHHDERAADLLRGPRRPATRSCGGSPWPIAAPRATGWCGPTAPPPTRASSTCQTGAFLRQSTHQGLRADSCWARGLAWSLYGFSKVYALTRHGRVPGRRRAERRLLAGAPAGRQGPLLGLRRRPVAAAALGAAKGQLGRGDRRQRAVGPGRADRLARRARPPTARRPWRCSTRWSSPSTWPSTRPAGKASSSTASTTPRKNLGVDESVMWGEFFFVEALTKAMRDEG